MFLLGYDLGSSLIKGVLLHAETGAVAAAASSPETELEILAPRPGWAEQHPGVWWEHVRTVTGRCLSLAGVSAAEVKAVGICYQMHGLVVVDRNLDVLRPAILWCDSRAVAIGERAFRELGESRCLERFLNSPGNFTASKLRWVLENEPEVSSRIHRFMLPGDYLAMKMTGEVTTTSSGLSEGILWDFTEKGPAAPLLEYYGIFRDWLPEIVPTFSGKGRLTRKAAGELGLAEGTPVSYRSGDQPNNAWSLRVLEPGEVAATAGTSGVVYGVTGEPVYDPGSRVNTFVHVNHRAEDPRYGILLCVNGAGILNRWLRDHFGGSGSGGLSYEQMNRQAADVPAGSGGLAILPYGNGAERTLWNRDIGASVHGLRFNVHRKEHFFRAAQEGIVFALNHGLGILREMGIRADTVRAGQANLFLSPLFGRVFAAVTGASVELYNTDNAQGAARGAGVGAGIYAGPEEAFRNLRALETVEPDPRETDRYRDLYGEWERRLNAVMSQDE